MLGSEPGALGHLATPRRWQTARGSNPSDQIESLGTSPEVKRFECGGSGVESNAQGCLVAAHTAFKAGTVANRFPLPSLVDSRTPPNGGARFGGRPLVSSRCLSDAYQTRQCEPHPIFDAPRLYSAATTQAAFQSRHQTSLVSIRR